MAVNISAKHWFVPVCPLTFLLNLSHHVHVWPLMTQPPYCEVWGDGWWRSYGWEGRQASARGLRLRFDIFKCKNHGVFLRRDHSDSTFVCLLQPKQVFKLNMIFSLTECFCFFLSLSLTRSYAKPCDSTSVFAALLLAFAGTLLWF